ncbi:hypothetical protein [Actinoplanes sichuanensis]|uniref:Uncharacterized protein n=1 Tax=Actinoplanes sichuanensis TaxID=512349 RepID=A0ABW4A4K8_9ACTN|nr:hypothetical protein [Actinoplanes sichuanensis]
MDQQLALHAAAVRLTGKFTGLYSSETIERFLHTGYDQFAPPTPSRTTCRC